MALWVCASPGPSSDFTFVVIPDPQNEAMRTNDPACNCQRLGTFDATAQWIVSNKSALNIQAVIFVGDFTTYCTTNEFQNYTTALQLLEKNGIVYVPVIGNHDYDTGGDGGQIPTRASTRFDGFFSQRLNGRGWFFPKATNSYVNGYVPLTINNRNFIILALELFPAPSTMQWATNLLSQAPYSGYEAVVVTHGYLNQDASWITFTNALFHYGPQDYGLTTNNSTDGGTLWTNYISRLPNIKLVVCGHMVPGNYSFRSDRGINGNVVNQIFANFQSTFNGGDGMLELIKVSGTKGTADVSFVKTANPLFWSSGVSQGPAANAGPDQAITSNTLPVAVVLAGSDRGAQVNYSWSEVSGPASVTFDNANAASTRAYFPAAGVYDLRLTAADGAYLSRDDVVLTVGSTTWYNSAWAFRKAIIIDHTKVRGDQMAFPVLVSTNHPDLKSVTYGGKVANSQGADLVFTDYSETKLAYEIETYKPDTGQLVAWVRIPTLSSSADTKINLYFGNAAALDQQNKAGVWDSDYVAVWHLQETSGQHLDSTSHANNSTVVSVLNQGGLVGKIGGADTFNTIQYVSIPATDLTLKSAFTRMTASAWVSPGAEPTDPAGYGPTIMANTDQDGWAMRLNGGILAADLRLPTPLLKTFGSALPLNTWSYVSFVYDGTQVTGYINGVAVTPSASASGAVKNGFNSGTCTFIGNDPKNCVVQDPVEFGFAGMIDEVRVSDMARSAGWIATEYANQADPVSFLSLGATQTKP